MEINPNERRQERKEKGWSEDPELGEGPPRVGREQRCPGAAVGFERFKSSEKGTPGLMVRFVALSGPDAGKITDRNFWLTQKAIGQFTDLVLAYGWTEPLNTDNDDHLEALFARGAVMMQIKGEDRSWTDDDGEEHETTRYSPAFFAKFKGQPADDWDEHVQAGQKYWDEYLKWRKENPRPKPGSSSGGSGGGSSSGGSRSRSSGSGKSDGNKVGDDSVPF